MTIDLTPLAGNSSGSPRNSLLEGLLRPSLGKKLGAAFLLFLFLIAGNLFLVEKLYEGISDTAATINESGKLRYLSQGIALRATSLAYGTGGDGKELAQLLEEFEAGLSAVEQRLNRLHPAMAREFTDAPSRLRELRSAWLSYRAAAEAIRKSAPGKMDAAAVNRMRQMTGPMLEIADGIVTGLTGATRKAHGRIDFLLRLALLAEAVFLLAIFFYLRAKVVLPVRTLSRLASRFAAGDRSVRVAFEGRDEIGELARNFNHTVHTVDRLINRRTVYFKEAAALHCAAQILQDGRRLPTEAMEDLLLILLPSFQYPESIVARIVFEGEVFVTPGFHETPWCLSADFSNGSGHRASVEACYVEEKPVADEGPFLAEERAVLNSLAEMLRAYRGRSRMQQASDRLAAVIEASHDLVGSATPEGKLLYMNRAGRDLLGIGADEDVTGKDFSLYHPAWAATVIEKVGMAEAAREGFWSGETALLGRDGGEIPVSQSIIAHRAPDGAVSYFSTIVRDISDRIRLEARLTRSRDFSLKLLREFPNPIWRSGTDGKCDYFNKAWLDFTGRKLEQELGDGWAESIHPDDRDACLMAYREAFDRRQAFEIEYRLRRHDGEYRWLIDSGAPYTDLDDNFAGYIGACYDITARKLAEEKARKLSLVVEETGNSVIITDRNGIIEYVNPEFSKVTGYVFEEAVGQKPGMVKSGLTAPEYYRDMWETMMSGEKWRGELLNRKKNGELFWEYEVISALKNEAGEITHFIAVKEDVTERKHYESQILHQANHDALTQLPNRNLLQDRLAQALAYVRRHERGLAVLFIDLDYFKNINDSLGHNAGDSLLKLAAVRLAGCVRDGDTVSRQGGDEFAVILADVAAEEDVTLVTRKILHAMSEPFNVEGHELFVTCSIGIALYPKDGEDGQTLLKNADAALYRAKDMGRNNSQFYTAEMNVKAMERLMLENSLRHALERREFLVYYQPRVDLRSGEITGMEALVRWQHPEQGLVSPARFIPVAEECGVIVPLGEWVLRTACAQNKAWQRAGLKPVCVAVNLSARQFRQQDLVAVVAGILKETDLDPAYLELEITESLIMQNVEATIDTLTRLKAMGVRFAIDDFGTGYSSLSYLKRFPIDMLKIDQSFVRDITTDPDDAAIAKTIISMAHDMGLTVIAEGVETEEQKAFLRLRQCDEMQGYFFSRPVPAEEFGILLSEKRCLKMDEAEAALSQRTLLLLDDEENILTSLTRLLRRDGYQILKATNAAAAFELLADHPVGVIISDQRMPEMNGTEFLRRVKQIHPDTVRMVLSGYTDLKSVTDAINEGAVYKFLTKPWDDDLLRANIQEAFQRYELVQDNQRLSSAMVQINDELIRAKRELERRMEKKTSEARHSVGVLQVSQEMFEYLPVGVIGMSDDGLIAVANRKAHELFDAGHNQPLLGCFASERLPAAMAERLTGTGERHACRLENGRNVIFWSHAMGVSSGSEGQVLVIVPNEESEG